MPWFSPALGTVLGQGDRPRRQVEQGDAGSNMQDVQMHHFWVKSPLLLLKYQASGLKWERSRALQVHAGRLQCSEHKRYALAVATYVWVTNSVPSFQQCIVGIPDHAR